MRLRPILRLLLAGLLAPVPSTLNPPFGPSPLTLDPPPARADSPGDWPMFRHDPGTEGDQAAPSNLVALDSRDRFH